MIIIVENENKRLHGTASNYPFVVTAYRSKTSRSPMARFATPKEAFGFVERLTGVCAVRYVQETGVDYAVETFTGVHSERFDWCQYQTPQPNIDTILATTA